MANIIKDFPLVSPTKIMLPVAEFIFIFLRTTITTKEFVGSVSNVAGVMLIISVLPALRQEIDEYIVPGNVR